MEKKPSSLRMLESFCECEQPYVERFDTWQYEREQARHVAGRAERKRSVQRVSLREPTKGTPQDTA